jgi:hypothetical protein
MTAYEIQKIEQSIIETENALARLESWSVEFQDCVLINFYHNHIARLKTVLAAAGFVPA